jgi:UDP-2,3-diacylglucosamine pyrophosphatase LpxH
VQGVSSESLLVFSDVHLGSDLNDHVKAHVRRSTRIDRDLVRFLEHYLDAPPCDGAARWRVVIAGDFIDFIGMSIDPESSDSIPTALTDEERAHGLGNASDHARAKMRRVAARHPEVFDALAKMVARGHALTLVHGNHDVEFHWSDVQNDFRNVLLASAHRAALEVDDAEFLAAIEFNPWFFYWNGVAYIEHGHQYDPFCATENLMAPLSPLDPRRVTRGFCDILLRYVVRPTVGLRESGHETMGLAGYISFGVKLGFRNMLKLGYRFIEAVVELFRLRRAYLGESARALREEHERRMGLLAEATRIGIERLRALAALQSPPITRSIRGILASVLLDRLALALLCSILLVVSGILGMRTGHFFIASALIAAGWIVGHRYLSRKRQLDPAEQMADRASQLARLLPAAFVVMGHTHAPIQRPVADGAATYINVGAWAEEEPEAGSAPRTHLVISVRDGKPIAELRTWSAEGPRRY